MCNRRLWRFLFFAKKGLDELAYRPFQYKPSPDFRLIKAKELPRKWRESNFLHQADLIEWFIPYYPILWLLEKCQ